MSEKRLILIGGGGHCKAVIDVALSAGRTIYGILDNAIATGNTVLGVPVIGNDNDISSFVDDNTEFIITVGQIHRSAIRRLIAERVKSAGGVFATPLIASTAHIAKGVTIGNGTVIMHNAIINSDATIGKNTIINTGAIVEHDCSIGDFVHISTGAIVNGVCTIDSDTFIGSHATVINCMEITKGVVIGAGATVTCDITHSGTYCGTPAKPIK